MSSNDQKKVLLVDDEPDITMIMKIALRKFGFTLDTFNDPKVALSQFRPNYYGAIILDVRMPSMTGFELAAKIWAKDPDARICFCSAYENYRDETKALDLKAHCFVKKPIIPSDLAKHIETHFLTASEHRTKLK